jgi:serine/threonine protein phosphatase PrpC
VEGVSGPVVEWGVAAMPLPGQTRSGDRHLVKRLPHALLLAVVDGLGHGEEAAEVAGIAVATLERHADEPVVALLERCHERLAGTRGVVMSVARFDGPGETMTWGGVGNVEARLVRARAAATSPAQEVLLPGRGVVGGSLTRPRASVLPVTQGDTLVLATDGLDSAFAEGATRLSPPQELADRLLATYGRGTDDALVLVARYGRPGP